MAKKAILAESDGAGYSPTKGQRHRFEISG